MRKVWLLGLFAAALSALPQQPSRVPGQATTGTERLSGHVLKVLPQATKLPRTPEAAQQQLTLTIMLNWSDPAGFESYAREMKDPKSPNFRRTLGPAEVSARFGPTQQAYDAVLLFLQENGFQLAEGSANRLTITVRGSRAQAERAFAVHIDDYRMGSRTFQANDTEPAIPSVLRSYIRSISGLSNLALPRAMAGPSPPDPMSIATAYNAGGLPPGINGAGQTVGLIEYDNFNASDVQNWLAFVGLPASMINQLSQLPINGGTSPSGGKGTSEVLVDIYAVLGTAQGAKVIVCDAPQGTPQIDVINSCFNGVRIVSGGTAGSISDSWFVCEAEISDSDADSLETLLQAFGMYGLSFFAASGDNGSTCASPAGSFANRVTIPAGAPDAVAVGGTNLQVGQNNSYSAESWWNNQTTPGGFGAGGFGVSLHFPRPSYQDPFTNAFGRSVPDISADAIGVRTCQGTTPAGTPNCRCCIAGTSVAAPIWAGVWALACQTARFNFCPSANAGFIYGYGNLNVFHPPASMTGLGNDFAHLGLGSPNITNLVSELAGAPEVDSATPASGPGTGGTQVVLKGRAFIGVTGVQFSNAWASAAVPPSSFSVDSQNQITLISPPWSRGADTVNITVTTPADSSMKSPANQFNYKALITSLNPTSGPMQGGTTVTIIGQGFNATVLHGTQVYFGSTPSPNVYCDSSSSCVAATPPHNPGQVPVTVSANGVQSQAGDFVYELPTINSMNPSIGPETGGTLIDIHGVSFAQGMSVSFRNTQSGQSTPATWVTCQDNTWCTIQSPPGTGAAEINPTVNGFTSIPNPPYDVFTYKPFPAVSSITPADGPATGGTPVSVSGTNFSFAPTVQFGANAATSVRCSQFMGANLWTCQTKSPPGSRKVDVTVSVNGMTSLTGPADQFTYIPVVANASPVTGPQNGGTKVSITGAGFAPTQHVGDTTVSFGANSVSPNLVSCSSSTSCVVTSPAAKLPRVGGVDITVTVDGQTSAVNRPGDLFTYTRANLSGWTQWYPSTSPPGGITRNLIYDATRGVMLYFGSSTLRNPIAQTWTWDGASWSQLTPLTNPNGRVGAFAFDAATGTAILFGGFDPSTWLWDGSNWNSVLPPTHPSARAGASMTYDPTNKVIVLFGGCANQTCSALLNDTWTWNGSNWTQQNPPASPPPRSEAYLAYDSATGTAVLFGGMSSSARLNDTWVWNGSTWIQLHPATSPSPREGTCMTYDPFLGGLVLFGGMSSNGSVSDLWTWNGSTWSQLATAGPHPDCGSGAVMDYDASLQAVVLLGLDGSTWTWQR